jgi:hypothetical protein
MISFRDWYEREEKPWEAKKPEILNYWKNLPNNVPIRSTAAIPHTHKGSSYKYDGVRVTGSGQFIHGVVSRLKDVMGYESDKTELQLTYRQQVDRKTEQPIHNSFVFYAQVKDRKNNDYEI